MVLVKEYVKMSIFGSRQAYNIICGKLVMRPFLSNKVINVKILNTITENLIGEINAWLTSS